MVKAKSNVVAKGALSLYDIDTVAPDFFELPIDANAKVAAEWVGRASAFVRAMHGLDRVVMLRFDESEGTLYLSSMPDHL